MKTHEGHFVRLLAAYFKFSSGQFNLYLFKYLSEGVIYQNVKTIPSKASSIQLISCVTFLGTITGFMTIKMGIGFSKNIRICTLCALVNPNKYFIVILNQI